MSALPPLFEPVAIDNAMRVVRPRLGSDMPIALFRLVRLVVMEDFFGRAAGAPSYLAGKKLGKALGLTNLDQFLELCEQLKIGLVEVSSQSENLLHVDVHECVSCAGVTPVGRTLCAFEGGLIAGVVSGIKGGRVRAREITCIGGLGDATCGFDITIE